VADVCLVYILRCLGCYLYSIPQAFCCNYTDIFVHGMLFSLVILVSVPNPVFPSLAAGNVICRRHYSRHPKSHVYGMGEKSPYTKQCLNIINHN